ncbi:DUF397 domain-containing protein [Streptomyces ortus]|uniref:DUF397 domain-containing protein n=1 Tax=Streptomyces ortus TaxID=2867268 RepID=A0ABT3UW69_9ACTN|nr:DUF397 domain-containing protein [Streptomyces ortus]MCX4231809.1 DUF397 domain-containing protein [Streptomyces ortus]
MNGSWSWQRSSFSDASGNQCVEVARTSLGVMVRDSKDIAAGRLAFGAAAWSHFTALADVSDNTPTSG